MNTKTDASNGLDSLCKNFIKRIESLAETLPFIMLVLQTAEESYEKKFEEFIISNGQDIKEDDDAKTYFIKIEKKGEHDKLQQKVRIHREALGITPRSFLVSLISSYDAYLGDLLYNLFLLKPEIINASNSTLTFLQLSSFESLENARDYIIEKEVETVLRKSHDEQFTWMENTFNIPLRKGLDCWPDFIELTERRNLFVHNGGKVSSQYICNCEKHNVSFESSISNGDRLNVPQQYYENSANCIMEIGIKLAHVLWRKLAPANRCDADKNLLEVIYSLLLKEKYLLAERLGEFCLNTLKKYSNEEFRRMFVVNLAIAYKFGGNEKKAVELLNNEDWSAIDLKFQLAVRALLGEFEESANIMRLIGKDGSIGVLEYNEWPVFKELRLTSVFKQTFKEIFKKDFKIEEKKSVTNGDENE